MPAGLNSPAMLPPTAFAAIDIRGRTQTCFAYTNAVAVSNFSVEGYYDIWATTNCYIAISNSNAVANAVAANTGYWLGIMSPKTFRARPGDILGAIAATANGTLAYIKVG
jgi:hypothetical protein